MSITIEDFAVNGVGEDDGVSFIHSDEPTCTECGKEIGYLYGGRGRKPTKCEDHKRSASSGAKRPTGARANNDVESAVAALRGAYDLLSFGLMMFAPQAASLLAASLDSLDAKNRTVLVNDKELVRQINRVGKTGGRAAFVVAQLSVIAPVAVLATAEVRERMASREPLDVEFTP